MAKVSEFAAIEVLRRGLSRGPSSSALSVGIGDDAAVLRRPAGELVCSVDSSLEGVHFDSRWLSVELAARRATHAAVSDLAAMGADPLAAVVALEIPKGTSKATFAAIARGQARAARETGCPVVGGNITRGKRLAFTTTVLGTCKRGQSVLRSEAKPGDEIWLSDEVGWAGLGLSVLQAGQVTFTGRGYRASSASVGRAGVTAAQHWSVPSAKVATGQAWRGRANSMIDISDSLASEAGHLAEASEVRLVLDAEALGEATRGLSRACETLGRDPLELVLYGGEDYALLATGPSRARPYDAKVIGLVERGKGAWLLRDGKRTRLRTGFDHLRA
jgi:thiamine-monophosphate kinase